MSILLILQDPGSPDWPAWLGLILSVFLAVLKAHEWWSRQNASSELHVAVTPEMFIRITDSGEVVFANVVMFASRRPAFVESVSGVLAKTDSGKVAKEYGLSVSQMGTRVDRGVPLTDHSFFSASAIDLVPVDTPVRRVYMLRLDKYRDQLVRSVEKYRQEVVKLVPDAEQFNEELDEVKRDLLGRSISDRLKPSREEFVQAAMDAVQFEDGEYRLTLSFWFRDAHSGGGELREIKSGVDCVFSVGARDQLRVHLRGFAEGIAVQMLFKGELAVYPPTVRPTG